MNGRGIEVRRETAEARLMDGRAFAAALVIFSLISGCGGDASSYTADGDAICARVVADSRALFRTTGSAPAARDRAFSRIVRAPGRAVVGEERAGALLARRRGAGGRQGTRCRPRAWLRRLRRLLARAVHQRHPPRRLGQLPAQLLRRRSE